MTRLVKKELILLLLVTGLTALAQITVAADKTAEQLAQTVDPSELLEVEPVAEPAAVPEPSAEPNDQSPYPVNEWSADKTEQPTDRGEQPQPVPVPEKKPVPSGNVVQATLLSPYFFSAYSPRQDQTEVDLGLVLSQHPGLDVAITWGAMEQLLAAAHMTVQGASYTAGARLSYQLRPEMLNETKPGLAAVFGWRVQNYRNDDEERTNIFRGNRLALGAVASKDIGSLALSLDANKDFIDFLKYFRIHVEAVAEFQTGRIDKREESLARIEFGLRSALEIMVVRKKFYINLTYNSLSDWINGEDQYLGVRYYPRKDFALDLIGGWFGNQTAVILNLAWIF